MNKKIKSAVISIAVLLLAILIGVKNGTLDKLTKEMPTLEQVRQKRRSQQKTSLKKMKAVATLLG